MTLCLTPPQFRRWPHQYFFTIWSCSLPGFYVPPRISLILTEDLNVKRILRGGIDLRDETCIDAGNKCFRQLGIDCEAIFVNAKGEREAFPHLINCPT